MGQIAIIDDREENFKSLKEMISLEAAHYQQGDFPKDLNFIYFAKGEDFFNYPQRDKIDMVLLDYFLSNETGDKVCHKIRAINDFKSLPIIFVSGSGYLNERVLAFEAGANDFIARPFHQKELFYRLKVHWRNKGSKATNQMGNLVFDSQKDIFYCAEQELKLSQKEFFLLKFLFENRSRIIYREEVKSHVWGGGDVSNGNIDTQIYNLKKKLALFNGEIRTLNRIGFRLVLKES